MFIKLKVSVGIRNLKTSFSLDYTGSDGLCLIFGNEKILKMLY